MILFYNLRANSQFQRYVVRKLTDIMFKISSLQEEHKRLCRKLDILFDRFESSCPEEVEKRDNVEDLIQSFPINDMEDLQKLEKSLLDGNINRKELVS